MSLQDKASIVLPKGFAGKASVLECWNPNTDSLVGLSVVRATTATRVNESGLIESVAANVPRRDFTNGGCGDLLVEPQRTNLNTYSEDLTNPTYSTFGTETSVTTNADTAPDGTNTADQVNILSGTGRFGTAITLAGDTTYTISFYCKNIDVSAVDLLLSNTDGGADGSYFSEINTSDYTRIERTFTTDPGTPLVSIQLTRSATIGGRLYIWGVQVEEGSYATSYIPTVASAVTRNADVISGTGLAALLNKNSGGIYINAAPFDLNQMRIVLTSSATSSTNTIRLSFNSGSIIFASLENSINASVSGAYTANNFVKAAGSYSTSGGVSLSVDGSAAVNSAGNGGLTNDLAVLNFYAFVYVIPFFGRIRELVIFDEAPDDTQLAAITTP